MAVENLAERAADAGGGHELPYWRQASLGT